MAFSPDGRYLAAGDDRQFHLWDAAASSDPLWSLSGTDLEQNFAFTPDSGHLVGGQYGHYARYSALAGEGVAEPLGPAFYTSLFVPGGRFVTAAVGDHGAGLFRLRSVIAPRPAAGGRKHGPGSGRSTSATGGTGTAYQCIERGAFARGRVEGIAVGVQNSVLAALRKRFGAVSPEVEERVKAVTDIARLEAALLQTFDIAAADELVI